jgi:hypothetical protein
LCWKVEEARSRDTRKVFSLFGFFVQQFGLVANEVVLIERERERERDGCGFVRRFFQVLECVQGSGWE